MDRPRIRKAGDIHNRLGICLGSFEAGGWRESSWLPNLSPNL